MSPAPSLWPRLAAAAVALLACAWLLHAVLALHSDRTPPQHDEMTYAGAGARLAAGELPYRDVHLHVPPAMPVLHAVLHRAFGPRLLVLRAVALLAWIAAWAMAARLLLAGSARGAGVLLGACLAAAGAFSWWPHSYHHWWGVLAVLAWVLVDCALAREESRPLSVAWAVTLLLMPLVDQTSALVGLVAAGATVAGRIRRHGLAAGERSRLLMTVSLGAALTLALAASGLLVPMLRDVVAWPLTAYSQAGGSNDMATFGADLARRLALSPISAFAGIALAAAWPLAAVFTLAPRGIEASRPLRLARVLLLAVPLAFLPGRHDVAHAAFLAPLVLLGVALASASDRKEAVEPSRGARRCGVAAVACGLAALAGPLTAPSGPLPTAQSWTTQDDEWARDAVVVGARAAAEANGGSLAVLSRGGMAAFHGVPSPLPWIDLLPAEAGYGHARESDEAAAILRREEPRWLLLSPLGEAAPFLTEESELGRLLRERYRARHEMGDALFLERARSIS